MLTQMLRSLRAVVILGVLPMLAAAAAEDAATTQSALSEVTRALNALDQWLNDAGRREVQAQQDIARMDRAVNAGHARLAEFADALRQIETDLADITAQRAGLENDRQQQALRIAEHIRAAYRLSGEDMLKLLLNNESPEDLQRMIRYHRYFSDARLAALGEYQTTLARLAETTAALEVQQSEATNARKNVADQQATLLEEKQQRETQVAALRGEIDSKTEERDRLIADRDRLERLLAELRRRAVELDGTAFAQNKGKLPWPARATVAKNFGQSRAGGKLKWHGMLLQAPAGRPVNAVFRGRVIFADWLRGYGLLCILDHGSGYMTLYGHLDNLSHGVGDWVEPGEVIAYTGTSGGQQEPGLYFEVRQKGTAVNPLTWLNKP